jgi:hypothetical protein
MTGQPQSDEQAAVEKLCAQLIRLANSPENGEEKADIRRWAQSHVSDLANRPLEKLPFTSIAAHVLNSLGKVSEAFALSEASVRQHGLDELCIPVINRVRAAILRGAFDAMEAKRPDLARANLSFMLDKLGDILDLIDEHALANLLSHVDAIRARRAGVRPVDGRPTLIKLAVWGESYLLAAERNVLCCCLAPGNVPALTAFGPVIVHIHTRGRDVDRVRSLAAVRELERHAEIKIETIPEELFIPTHMYELVFWYRTILAMAEYDSVMYARQIGADMICLGADMVISDGYLSEAKKKLSSGYDMFMTSPLRVLDDTISAPLAHYRHGSVMTVPADELYRLSLATLHPAMRLQFMCVPPQHLPADPHQFFFTCAEGFAAHAFQWHPLALSARSVAEDVGFDGQTIDCRFASDLLAGKDLTRACYLQRDPPHGGYMVSLDSARGIARFGNFDVSPDGVAGSAAKWIRREEDFGYFSWLLRQRAFYRVPPGLPLDLPGDGRDEDGAVDEIVKGLENRRPDIVQRIGRYARPAQ